MTVSYEVLQWIRIAVAAVWLTTMTICIYAGRAFPRQSFTGPFLMGFVIGSIFTVAMLWFIWSTG